MRKRGDRIRRDLNARNRVQSSRELRALLFGIERRLLLEATELQLHPSGRPERDGRWGEVEDVMLGVLPVSLRGHTSWGSGTGPRGLVQAFEQITRCEIERGHEAEQR